MKKYTKILVLFSVCIAMFFIFSQKAEAVTLDLNYNSTNSIEQDKKYKLHPGDEVFISFTIKEDYNKKIMAVYGNFEYDKDVLEIVNDKDIENPKMGEKWLAGNVNSNDNTFFFYTLDPNRENTAGYIKFRVKDNITRTVDTVFSAKDVVFYERVNNSNYQEISPRLENVSLNIKISKNKYNKINTAIFILIIVIAIIIIAIIIYLIRKKDEYGGKNRAYKQKIYRTAIETEDKKEEGTDTKKKKKKNTGNREQEKIEEMLEIVKNEDLQDELKIEEKVKKSMKNNKRKNNKSAKSNETVLDTKSDNNEENKKEADKDGEEKK